MDSYKIGMTVRISKVKDKFEKGAKAYSVSLYKIIKIDN
jgi:hypothetical protein